MNFDDYPQFDVVDNILVWTEEKKGSSPYGRLKDKALTCMSSSLDKARPKIMKFYGFFSSMSAWIFRPE